MLEKISILSCHPTEVTINDPECYKFWSEASGFLVDQEPAHLSAYRWRKNHIT